jgi:hypothetical protein
MADPGHARTAPLRAMPWRCLKQAQCLIRLPCAPLPPLQVHSFEGAGVALAMYNTEASIRGFAKASFEYALDRKWCARARTLFCSPGNPGYRSHAPTVETLTVCLARCGHAFCERCAAHALASLDLLPPIVLQKPHGPC